MTIHLKTNTCSRRFFKVGFIFLCRFSVKEANMMIRLSLTVPDALFGLSIVLLDLSTFCRVPFIASKRAEMTLDGVRNTNRFEASEVIQRRCACGTS